MNRQVLTVFGVILMALGVAVAWRIGPRGESSSVLIIGVLFPMSGDASAYGEKGQRAIELAENAVRTRQLFTKGGLRVVFEDSRAEPATGVSAMHKLVDVDHVAAVVGDIVSDVTLAVAPIAESKHVVLLSPTSSAPAISHAGEFIYRTWPSDHAEGRAIAEWALGQEYRTAAILHMQNDYGIAIADIFGQTFTDAGGTVLLRDGYHADAMEYRTALTRVRSVRPQVVFIAGYYADSATILRQARELNIEAQFVGTTAVEDQKFLELAGPAAEGLIYSLATGFDATSKETQTREFVGAFVARYDYVPGWVEAQAYDAFMLLVSIAEKCDSWPDGMRIKRGLDAMEEYKGVAGAIRFDANGDVVKPVRLKTVRDGKFQPLNG